MAGKNTGVKISNLEQENYLIENLLNSHYDAMLKAYWNVKSSFNLENQNTQDIVSLIYVLSGFFLFAACLVVIVVLTRGMSKRE